jgi:hypothetical protein
MLELMVRITRDSKIKNLDKKRAADEAALRSLTGRRQTKWLQPLGKNPDHWMAIVNNRKA